MNRERRNMLKKAAEYLDLAAGIIGEARDDEQDCLDNLPENLQNSERSEMMEGAIENLEEAIERIEEAKSSVDCATM